MSIGSISDCLASSIAFSAVPPIPIPSIPGGHHPAPIVGTVFSTHSVTESEGFSMMNLALASDPPPLAATVTSTVAPSFYLLGPRNGGLEITQNGKEICVITPQSPLGSML